MAVYLLLGNDEERKARGVEKLHEERTVDAYDAAETNPETVVAACNSYSLFGDGHFVLVKNLDAWNATQKAKIIDYLEDPSPATDLVLLGEKLGAREKLLSAVKKVGEVRSFEQPTGKALVRWTVGYGKTKGLELPEAVAEELVVRCSDDKVRVSREVEKLSLYVSGAATLNDVEVLVSPDLQANIFAFVDSLAAGDQDDAMSLLEALIATGEPPLRITYMLRRQFRLLARAHALNKSGASRSEVTSTLKVPPFVARKLEEQSRKMNQVDFEGALAAVLDLERGLKGRSDLDDELQVELTVLKLADPMG